MIDIHTHILPYIDDGAKNIEEALIMTECLESQQIHAAVCTPHFDSAKISLEEFTAKREKAILTMNSSRITLISGSETLYRDMLYQYSDLDQLCIHNTRYLLLELPYKDHWGDLDVESIEKLMNLFQVIPVLAHIERYHFLWKSKQHIKQLINMGCVMQINANTIIDKKQRKTALHYIKKGYIDVVGSDCHNMFQRPPNLRDAFVIIEKEIGRDYCDRLQQNANLIIKGKMIRNDTGQFMLREVN